MRAVIPADDRRRLLLLIGVVRKVCQVFETATFGASGTTCLSRAIGTMIPVDSARWLDDQPR